MKHRVFKFVTVLLFVTAVSLPFATSAHAEASNHAVDAKETMEMNGCDQMEMMKKQMKPMMDNHKMMMKNMKSLFEELQQGGNLTQEQIKKMNNIEQMMKQMGEKMEQMSVMESEELK